MGDCVSSNPGPRPTHSTDRTAPMQPNRNKTDIVHYPLPKTDKPKTPITVEIHKMNNLNPILRPVLPKSQVNPRTNPRLGAKITVVPNEFF